MTETSQLVGMLREWASVSQTTAYDFQNDYMRRAADRLELLEAENKSLRDQLRQITERGDE